MRSNMILPGEHGMIVTGALRVLTRIYYLLPEERRQMILHEASKTPGLLPGHFLWNGHEVVFEGECVEDARE